MKNKLFLIIVLLFAVTITAVSCTAEEEPATLQMPPTPTLSPAVVTQGEQGEQEEDISTMGGGGVSTPLPITPAVTASPLPPATATTTPPVLEGLPATTHNLLFLADGGLKLWRHNPAQIDTLMMGGTAATPEQYTGQRVREPLLGDIAALTVSNNGTQAVIAKLLAKTAYLPDPAQPYTSTVGTYELIYLNLATGEQRPLLSGLHSFYPPAISISPNGQTVAISGLSTTPIEQLTLTPQMVGTLYVMETAVSSIPTAIDSCANACSGLVWHNDGNLFVYGNQDGLKMFNIAATAPELLVDGAVNNEFPWGKHFTPVSWANNGRSLLTWYSQYIEGSERAVFDMPTKNVMIVPNSGAYVGPFAHMEWMYDARLFVVRQNETNQAIGETFRVDGDNNQLVLDETVLLSTDVSYPAAPMHWQNGRFAYALFNVNSDFGQANGNNSGLYQRISFNEDAERLNDTPSLTDFFIDTAWEKESGSSLVIGDRGTMWIMPTGGAAMTNMQTAVGNNAHSFNWLP